MLLRLMTETPKSSMDKDGYREKTKTNGILQVVKRHEIVTETSE